MLVQEENVGSKVSRAKTKRKLPWTRALHAAHSTPAQWAAAMKLRFKDAPGPEAARSWLKKQGMGGRPIPRRWADFIEAENKDSDTPVPATLASWPNGFS